MKTLLSLVTLAALSCASLAHADSWKDESRKHRGGEGKEVFYEGPCKIEREWKKDGEYKEKRECKPRREYRQGERKEKFRDGPCKIEREWKKNGEFKEERECEQRPRREYRRDTPPEVIYYPEPEYRQVVPAQQGVVIQGTIRTK